MLIMRALISVFVLILSHQTLASGVDLFGTLEPDLTIFSSSMTSETGTTIFAQGNGNQNANVADGSTDVQGEIK